jgi:hypothetical protein
MNQLRLCKRWRAVATRFASWSRHLTQDGSSGFRARRSREDRLRKRSRVSSLVQSDRPFVNGKSSFPRSGVGTLFMPLRGVFKLNRGEYTGPIAN